MQTIFCVEDDDNIRELVIYALKASGFNAEGFANADLFYSRLNEKKPTLVLLDVMLPGEDGISILSKIRKTSNFEDISVIMLTAKNTEYDKVCGLDSGADDYITKPFGVMELIARVRAVLRRAKKIKEHEVLTLKGVVLDASRRSVIVDNTEILLTFKEFELLQYFMQNVGIVLSREKIMSVVWGFDFEGESRTVDMHVKTLRKKLGNYGSMICTVRGIGYKMDNCD